MYASTGLTVRNPFYKAKEGCQEWNLKWRLLRVLNVVSSLIQVMDELWHVVVVPQQQWVIVGMPSVLVANMSFYSMKRLNRRNSLDVELPDVLFEKQGWTTW